MWKCADVEMCKCGNVQMWECGGQPAGSFENGEKSGFLS
jgi:hypothetical protein